MSEQLLEQQNEQPPVEEKFVGGESAQPEAVDRGDRQDHARTPAEERQALNERLKAKRDADREDRIRVYEEQSQTLPVQPLVTDDQAQQHQQDAPQSTPQVGQDERKYRLRYNHEDVYLTEAEVIRQAQIGMHSETKLSEIQRTLAEIKQSRDNAPRPSDQAHQAPSRDKAVQESSRTKGSIDLRQLAEYIQTGDADEGVQALETLKSNIMEEIRREQPQLSPDDVADRVEERFQSRQAESEFQRYFSDRHPELAGHQGLLAETGVRMHQDMIRELRVLRRTDGKMLTEQELQPALQDLNTAIKWGAIYALQGVRRYDGNPMANPIQIMDWAADRTKQELGIQPRYQQPAPQPAPGPDQNRQARVRDEKRNLYEPRPAQTGYRQGGQDQVSRMSPEQKRSMAVAQRRQATGFDRIT